MIGKTLKFFGWQNKIDLSSAGLDDLKIMTSILGIFIGINFFNYSMVVWNSQNWIINILNKE